MALLDIDFSKGFQCTQCGSTPSTIVMDATGLAFRRELGFFPRLLMDIPKEKIPKGRYEVCYQHVVHGSVQNILLHILYM